MRKTAPLLAAACLALASVNSASAFTLYQWSGQPPTNWRGGVTPLFNGTEDFLFGNAVRTNVQLFGNPSANTLLFLAEDDYTFTGVGPVVLSVNGLSITPGNFTRIDVASNINLQLSGTGTSAFDVGQGSIVMRGQIVGTGNIGLLGGNGSAYIFNNPTGNTYSGTTVIGGPSGAPTVAFWNSSPFGTGAVTLYSGGTLVAHNAPTVANALTLNLVAPQAVSFRSWDGALTFSGGVTVANNTTLIAQGSPTALAGQDQSGSVPLPGPLKRHPIIFTGAIGESGGARALTIGGAGIFIFNPSSANTYTGGTFINGSAIFANANAIPAGTNNVTVNLQGYAGFTAANFSTEAAAHINKNSNGAIGVDTLPGDATVSYSDINLSLVGDGAVGFANTNTQMRIGTATSAILTGSVTPQGNNYLFGNGGGSLYVQASLDNRPLATSDLKLIGNSFTPLKLFLQGPLGYTGQTTSNLGFLILDGGASLPSVAGSMVAEANNATPSLGVGSSYIGVSNAVDTSIGLFLSKFNAASTWGIVGFDTHDTDPTASFDSVSLTGFNNGVFIGTATRATLTGTITPTTVANADNAANTLRLTAGNGGKLYVATTLADLPGPTTTPLSLMLGSPNSANPGFSNGTVILENANTYTGGTRINTNPQGLTVEFGSSNAFGTGLITVYSPQGGITGLQASSAGLTISNNILSDAGTGNNLISLTGTNEFTLAGAISGQATFQMYNPAPLAVTFSGNNSGLNGSFIVRNGTLKLGHNEALGNTVLFMGDPSATVQFVGGATAPIIRGIEGTGYMVAPNGTTVTFDTSAVDRPYEFEGVIGGIGATATTASVVVTSTNPENDILYLAGNNLYTGGTTITGTGILGLGANGSAGTGAVTVDAPTGGIVLNTGVTFTNSLNFQRGALAGFGAFDPSNTNTLVFGTDRIVVPGIAGLDENPVGTLTLKANTEFANGGSYIWSLQDGSLSDGFSKLMIEGDLNISATAGGFALEILTFDVFGVEGFANLVNGQSYSLPILTVTGAITGFNPTAFTILAPDFQNGTLTPTQFSLSLDTAQTSILLSFVPVPEPSTYALLAAGLGFLGLTLWRRRS